MLGRIYNIGVNLKRGNNMFTAGAMVGVFLVASLSGFIIKKIIPIKSFIYVKYLLTAIIVTIISGYGYADGGEPKFIEAFDLYFIPILLVFILDLIFNKNKVNKIQAPN